MGEKMVSKEKEVVYLGYSDRMYRDYLKEVEESGILKRHSEPKYDQKKNDLITVLENSKYLARREFKVCHKDVVVLFESISAIESEMHSDLKIISSKYDSYEDAWKNVFDYFNKQLLKIFTYAQNTLVVQFSKKVKRMDHFCICLFGRTKAGKSTTMEALTEGDGKTIGVGRQNTTKDVKEYQWKELLIIDTPGIDAMEKFDKLESMALSFADDSDLIVFLMPHQIEEGDFEKFSRFYKQNKPILILLNVKKEIGMAGSVEYKMFLRHSEDVLNEDKIAGYKERIKDFVFENLNIDKNLIPIIPVHSASAFASLREEKKDISNKLYQISNFDNLKKQLTKEVKEYGELYRIKNPYDTVILFAEEIVDSFTEFDLYLRKQKDVFETNVMNFEILRSEIIKKRNGIIRNTVIAYLDSKKKSIPQIIDQLFSEKKKDKRDKIMKDFIPEDEVKSKVEMCRRKIVGMIKKEIEDFFKQLSSDLHKITLEEQKTKFSSNTEDSIVEIEGLGELSDIFEGIGLISSVILGIGTAVVLADVSILGAAGTLFGLGSANFWNPVGWGLFAGSAVMGILGLFARKKQKEKIRKAKIDAKNDLEEALNKGKNEIEKHLNDWTKGIISEIRKKHINVMKEYVKYVEKHLGIVDQLSNNMTKIKTRSEKRKFRAMIRCITDDSQLQVYKVEDSDKEVFLYTGKRQLKGINSIQKKLSRVEEKKVIITGG